MIPQKRAELSEWIRQELGEPVFDAIPIAGVQVENAIDDALDYYQTFGGNFAFQLHRLRLELNNLCPRLRRFGKSFSLSIIFTAGQRYCENQYYEQPFLCRYFYYHLVKEHSR